MPLPICSNYTDNSTQSQSYPELFFLSRTAFPIQNASPHSLSAGKPMKRQRKPRASNGSPGWDVVELRGHVSNSCRLAITFCWWLWQREARSFPLIHEQNQKAPCKGGQIIGFAIEYHCPAWSPRGEAQPPISFKRDEDRT